MTYDFDMKNPILKQCLEIITKNSKDNHTIVCELQQVQQLTNNDFENFITYYYLSKYQSNYEQRITYLNKAIEYAIHSEIFAVYSSLPYLYTQLSITLNSVCDYKNAKVAKFKADEYQNNTRDVGPFYHGTRADLHIGDMLSPGFPSNYQPEIIMNHIYFTTKIDGAGFAAALASGNSKERVYIVEPVGNYENDPNVTDMKFPGNLTRAYRSDKPLKIIGEIEQWNHLDEDELNKWREKMKTSNQKILN